MNKIIKRTNAITLIALVITIIVLLILGGITVAQLSGNGLFENAKIAKEKHQKSKELEDEKLEEYENKIENYVSGNRDYSTINYSFEEQNTGMRWVDNKPIYQKTVSCGALPNNGEKVINHGVTNIDIVISATGITYKDDKSAMIQFPQPHPTVLGASTNLCVNRTTIGIFDAYDRSDYKNTFVTFKYTKTTDNV